MNRRYSIEEIDRMRVAVHRMYRWANNDATPAAIEDRLRTFMANGSDPDEMEKIADQRAAGFMDEYLRDRRI
jgi:hypothetical protein